MTEKERISYEKILLDYYSALIPDKDSETFNNSLLLEEPLYDCIKNGDFEELRRFTEVTASFTEANPGLLSKDPIRNQKYHCIILVTLVSRAAIRGGMNVDKALKLSDLLIQGIDECNSIDRLEIYVSVIVKLYVTEVQTCKKDFTPLREMRDVIEYIRRHTNRKLTVADIATHFGYNSDYLSHKFKKELGFSISAFILRIKLEEANQLLLYSNKSLSEISTYLCFSSQSHFQRAYKKQYGITPGQKRRGH